MNIYHYDDSGVFRGTTTARQDPLAGGFLVPRNAAAQAPPECGENEVAVFRKGQWEKVADYRGVTYYVPPDRTGTTITELDEEPPEGAVLEQWPETPEEALVNLRAAIIAKRQEKNIADFTYEGTLFVSDEPNIQGVRLRIEGLPDSDPIPTFTGTELSGTWRSAENTFVPFNCGEFRDFSNFYYNHREKNFTNYTVLTIAAMTAYANGATAEELNDFDISQGWS